MNQEIRSLSSRLALVSKALDSANIEGGLHIPRRLKRPKAKATLFEAVRKYSPDQPRGAEGTAVGGQFVVDPGGGAAGPKLRRVSAPKEPKLPKPPKAREPKQPAEATGFGSRVRQTLMAAGAGALVGGAIVSPVARAALVRVRAARIAAQRAATAASRAASRAATHRAATRGGAAREARNWMFGARGKPLRG